MTPREQDSSIRQKLRGYSEPPPDFDRDRAWSRLAASLPDERGGVRKRYSILALAAVVALLVGLALRSGLQPSSGVDDLHEPALPAPAPAMKVERMLDTTTRPATNGPDAQNAIQMRKRVRRKMDSPSSMPRQAPTPMRINPAFAMPFERLRIYTRPSSLYGISAGKPIESLAFHAGYFHDTPSFSKPIQTAP